MNTMTQERASTASADAMALLQAVLTRLDRIIAAIGQLLDGQQGADR